MKQFVWLLAIVFAFGAVIVGRNALQENNRKRREEAFQAALLHYSNEFTPGMTRTAVAARLKSRNANFFEGCCYQERSAFAIVVKVGEYDAPWYCSEWPVYAIFEFRAPNPVRMHLPGDKSDVLQRVHVANQGLGCL